MADRDYLGSGENGLGLGNGEILQIDAGARRMGESRLGRNRGDERNESEEE